ncbi:MAG: membrane protein [Herpetosiphonaceae bacterium]|nr:MAG: membrane protein [Herpetosiphonaceae bacterium]
MFDLYRHARSPLAWIRLVSGLFSWALAVVLMVKSGLGLGPWDLFHEGLSRWSGLPMGVISELVGLILIVGVLLLRVWPGPGSIANMILIGVFIDLLLPIWPRQEQPLLQLLSFAAAIPLVGLGSGLYIGARLGAGPRDSLMLALSKRLGWSIRRVRTVVELLVLLAGWLLGGTIGIGTLLFALLIGPAVQWGMRICGALPDSGPALKHGEPSA